MNKKIYIIRHGESEDNNAKVSSSELTDLSDTGVFQAHELGTKAIFKNLDIIYTSPLKRSVSTAEIIAKTHEHLKVVKTKLITEKKDPSSFALKKRKDLPWNEIKKGRMGPDWKLEDGESFNDVKKRVHLTLKMVEDSPEKQILLISHGSFIKHLTLFVLLGSGFTPVNFYKFGDRMETKNTGITTFEFKQKYYETCPSWYLNNWMS